ncbi:MULTISPECIES: DUF3658 domain-containing protein [Stenotrophomonas]|uniref:DUF3658 domain-containing protein n=1 Tax=Stenotrophomonas nitritireducens TaxID=83617 RepID=UPI001379C969
MNPQEQPRESDLERVASLSGSDVQAIDAAVIDALTLSWSDAKNVVASAYASLLSSFPAVPDVFFSYRLRKLVAAGAVEAVGTVDRQLNYQVRLSSHEPAA